MKKRKAKRYIKNLIKHNLNETKAYQETNNCEYSTANGQASRTYDKLEDWEDILGDTVKYGKFPLEKIDANYIIGRLTELSNNAANESVKCRALELLGKYRELFTDKVKSEGQMTIKGLNKEDLEELRGHLEAINHNRLN